MLELYKPRYAIEKPIKLLILYRDRHQVLPDPSVLPAELRSLFQCTESLDFLPHLRVGGGKVAPGLPVALVDVHDVDEAMYRAFALIDPQIRAAESKPRIRMEKVDSHGLLKAPDRALEVAAREVMSGQGSLCPGELLV